MKQMILKFIGCGALFGLIALGASANSVSLNLSGMGTVTGTTAGAVNVTLTAPTAIVFTEVSASPCAFSANVSGVTFTSADVSGSISSLTVTQTAAQAAAGVASISGSGTATTVAGLTVNVPITFSGTVNVGAGVDLCSVTSPVTGQVSPTPEPGSLALMGMGIGMLGLGEVIRRRFA